MSNLKDRLFQLRNEKGLTMDQMVKQLSTQFPDTKISKSMISRWESGSAKPNEKNQKALAQFFRVTVDYLLGASEYRSFAAEYDAKIGPEGLKKLVEQVKRLGEIEEFDKILNLKSPVPTSDLCKVFADSPINKELSFEEFEEMPIEWDHLGEYFCLMVDDETMEPTIRFNDILVIHQQPTVEDNEIAVALLNDKEGVLRRIKKVDSGITLLGDNVAICTPRFFSAEEIENHSVKIIGKVVELRRSMN